MSPAELVWRIGLPVERAMRAAKDKLGLSSPSGEPNLLGDGDWVAALLAFRRGEGRPVLLDRGRAAVVASERPELVAELIEAADRAANLRFAFFGYPEVQLPQPVDWNYDPVADVRWPTVAASKIDHRNAAADVKWIWELNRLQHLPWLAQAWLFTGDDRYSERAFAQLNSWLAQNPPGRGIGWRGAFEAGIRAISVAVALQGLRDSPALTVERYRAVVTMLAQSGAALLERTFTLQFRQQPPDR